ncbi:alpha/beta fold hydrolase [Nonomuraea typhae]|uniref:alpha/beta fold hydrolase n=1 Tax=Nonomuraea typhae TaxID=2603600 RepID=UPI001FE89EBF|nr:alpha/beta fold hydrolase [Nonomuraea typhae]
MRVTMPGLTAVDHEFTVPLNHDDPGGASIRVFAREIADPARAGDDLPWAVFLQGGPGGKSPRLSGQAHFRHILKTHRVLLLDQRGTGRSTPAQPAGADYYRHFRADAIVRDCEHIRKALGIPQWDTWGQSYGGFITLTYLSLAPEGLRACHVTGGLAGLDATADEVYARTYPRVCDKTAAYYRRYPGDAVKVERIAHHLEANEVLLPDGDRLTHRRFQTLGQQFGMSDGYESVHWLLDEAWHGDRLSDVFLYQVMAITGFIGSPLYALMHEPTYAQGAATAWSAERLRPKDLDEPGTFTGEMIYPWMFDEIRALRPYKETAHALAADATWGPLYDPVRLAANQVPVAAVVYHDDMYVDAGFSLETAARVGNVRTWITNEYEHNGFRADGEKVTARLMDMIAGQV